MNLKEYREKTGMTQAAFAKQIGCSQHSVSRYEVGLSRPTPKVMSRIVTVTGGAVTPNDFYDVSDGQNAAANDSATCTSTPLATPSPALPTRPTAAEGGEEWAAIAGGPTGLSEAGTASGRAGAGEGAATEA